MAPEVATDRLREIIRKPISSEDLLRGCRAAWKAGYRHLKFYFMVGLPTETEDDLRAIVTLSDEASLSRKHLYRKRGRINVAVSSHVPKPHTPFQWEAMNTREELAAKQRPHADHIGPHRARTDQHVADRGQQVLGIGLAMAQGHGALEYRFVRAVGECGTGQARKRRFKDQAVHTAL